MGALQRARRTGAFERPEADQVHSAGARSPSSSSARIMEELLIDHTRTATFWIVGLYNGKPLDKEAADIVAWAWRALYAAAVKAPH